MPRPLLRRTLDESQVAAVTIGNCKEGAALAATQRADLGVLLRNEKGAVMRLDVSADRQVSRTDEAQRAITDDGPTLEGQILSKTSFRLAHSSLQLVARRLGIGVGDRGAQPAIAAPNIRQVGLKAAAPDDEPRRLNVAAAN